MEAAKERRVQKDRLTRAEINRRERERKRKTRRRVSALILFTVIAGISAGLMMYAMSNTEADVPLFSKLTEKLRTGKMTFASGGTAAYAPKEPTPAPTPEPSRKLLPKPSRETDLINIIARAGMKKRCYLTFDDGPSTETTPKILDVLSEYGIKATFFEVGRYIENNPDMTRRVYNEGHLIANHSYSHDYNAMYGSEESFRDEIEKCYELIKETTGEAEPFPLIRFPGGSYNSGDHAEEKQEYKLTLADMGFYYCDWNCVNGDAEGARKNSEELVQTFKDTSANFNNLIVLMHDTNAKASTAEALPQIIEYLREKGYTFHRLDDIDYNPQPTAE